MALKQKTDKEKLEKQEKKQTISGANTDHLTALFAPCSIAVIGASSHEKSAGYAVLKSLARGGAFLSETGVAFSGALFAVNPTTEFILGYKCFKSVLDIPELVDAAVLCVPAKSVLSVIKECAKKQVKVATILAAGFGETDDAGKKLQEQVLAIARQAKMRVLGPNSMGVIRPFINMNASFAATMPSSGSIAFLSQSGSLANTILASPAAKRYGFSCVVSYGNAADIDESDLMAWLADDLETKSIALYLEGCRDGRKLLAVAEQLSKVKPVIVLKGGATHAGAAAVARHHGINAGNPVLYHTAFEQAGVIEAHTVEELFEFAKTAASQPSAQNSIAVVTNSGAAAVLAADAAERHGVHLVQLKDAVMKKLGAVLAPFATHQFIPSHPLDLGDDAQPQSFRAALGVLLDQESVQGVIVVHTLQAMSSVDEVARVVAEARNAHSGKPVLTVGFMNRFSKDALHVLEQNGIPDFSDVHRAVKAMKMLILRGERLAKK
ncbi:MAG: CoA-binding protein [Candidatus Woesearchaeota archaeon]|nr:CoA-binding protein [Candidatus Woesearchaeota archaeon]